MSLLSNRGRFSKPEKLNLFNKDVEHSSALSLRGTNPNSLFKVDSNAKKVDDNIKDKTNTNTTKRIQNFDDNFVDNRFVNKHYEYTKKLPKKKKTSIGLFIAMTFFEILTLIAIIGFGTFIRVTKMTQKVSFDKAAVQNKNIDENTLAIMKGYKTVAIFGVDSRTGSVDKGNNSDVNLIANLNLETGDVQLISVYRDLYLSVTDNNTYDKLNAAYRRGGPESAVKTLNKNLDLNIENFFSFNWKAVADGIELLGGIDLEITKSEYRYMNAFIHETCIATGIDSKNPAAHYIKSSGQQHLDGVQAVAYGRLRLMDSDFQRVERQKRVIALCLEKAKDLDISKLRLIMEVVLPQIAYEFEMDEMISILKIVKKVNIVESSGVPETNNIVTMDMGSAGDCVVPLNLEKAVVKLHKILFDKDDYKVSIAVKRYSNRISELRQKYQAENAINASIKESEIEASNIAAITNISKTKSTKSNASHSNKSTKSNVNTLDDNRNVIPIVDEIEYNEEPEEDIVESNNNDEVIVNVPPGAENAYSDNQNNNDAPINNDVPTNIGPIDSSIDNTKNENINSPISYDAPGIQSNPNSNDVNNNHESSNLPIQNGPVENPGTILSPSGNQGVSSNTGIVVSGPPIG